MEGSVHKIHMAFVERLRPVLKGWVALVCLLFVVGCQAHTPEMDPGEDCFAVNGRLAPEWVEGSPPGPGVPVWCLPLFHVPSTPPTPRVMGVCRAEVSSVDGGGVSEERMRYDEQGRLVEWLANGRRHTWRYERLTLKTYLKEKEWDGQIEQHWSYDESGQIIIYEHQCAGNLIRTQNVLTRIDGILTEIHSSYTHDEDGRTRDRFTRVDPDTGAPAEVIESDWDGVIERRSQTIFDENTGDFVTIIDEAGKREESRGRCTSEGQWISLWGEVRVDSFGYQIQHSWPEGRSLVAYDAAGHIIRSYVEIEGDVDQDDGFVYDEAGRVICSQRLYWSGVLEWPPLREDVPGFCAGLCVFFGAIELPWGAPIQARAHMRYDGDGPLVEMALDIGADGSIEQILDLDVDYDDQGRLIRETWLGAWSLMKAEYEYDCPAER